MTGTVITVQGEFTASYPAERAVVGVSVHVQGPDKSRAFAAASASAESVTTMLEAFAHSRKVTSWSADRVQVWSEKPWNNEGKQLPPVEHASVGITARFADFEALATWLDVIVAVEGITVDGLSWELTDSTLTTALTNVRSRAVQDAVAKATVYAHSIRLSTVTPTALADPGMLDGQSAPGPQPPTAMRMMKADAAVGSPGLSLTPAAIEVRAAVDARFAAS
jgi:uncharacterized protein YggE